MPFSVVGHNPQNASQFFCDAKDQLGICRDTVGVTVE